MTKKRIVVDAGDGISVLALSETGRDLGAGGTVLSVSGPVRKHSYGRAVACPVCGIEQTTLFQVGDLLFCEVCYGKRMGSEVDRIDKFSKSDGDCKTEQQEGNVQDDC